MDADYSSNPYQHPLPPFAGRQTQLTRLDQYIKDPHTNSALVFLGQHGQGKTALLRRFDIAFDDPFMGIQLPLATLEHPTAALLIQEIVRGTEHSLAQREITVSRLPLTDPPPADWRTWFATVWLPEICQIIRPHRRLVVLLDDADRWLDAPDLAADRFEYFQQLLTDYPQLKLVMTFPAEREDELHKLTPLVDDHQIFRLHRLSLAEVGWLLTQPVSGRYDLTEAAVLAAHRATGGHPWLVQRLAAQLYDYQETHTQIVTITPEIIKQINTAIYVTSSSDLARWWAESSDNEQLVLLALSQLHYANPLQALDATRVANWLIDTDYPLDRTATNAVLRSLEYRELLTHQASGIELNTGLFQMWLLEHARQGLGSSTAAARWRSPLALVAALLVIIMLLIFILVSNEPQSASVTSIPQATVTLEN